jgi:hypothetical protein
MTFLLHQDERFIEPLRDVRCPEDDFQTCARPSDAEVKEINMLIIRVSSRFTE